MAKKTIIHFDREQEIPLLEVIVAGPSSKRRIRLVFDTGSAITQVDTNIIEMLGYSGRDGTRILEMEGPAGDSVQGYAVPVMCLTVLGEKLDNVELGAFDFGNFKSSGIDGLLGWDLIKDFHLEMNGPKGELSVFEENG